MTILLIVIVLSHFAVTLVVSAHIMLTKRDTASAIGWISTAFMMPFVGVCLYGMFGINRVRRLARRLVRKRGNPEAPALHYAIRSNEGPFAPLASMVGKLTGRPLIGGNCIDAFIDGDGTYPAMLEAIAAARASVLLSSYIFRGDRIGEQFIAALITAHNRGVAVRVLVDGIGAGYFICPAVRRLRAAGVPCSRFLHSMLPWRMPFINLRNHRKILVVDGHSGFIGGINIGDENVVAWHPANPVSDVHFRLQGPIVRQLTEAFAWDWAFTCEEDLSGEIYFPIPDEAGDDVMRVVTSGPDTDLEKIEFTMLQAITLAKTSIRLMTPYFLPGTRISTELGLAALRGVVVDIIIPQASNHLIMDWACRADIHPVLDAGCRVWLAEAPFNHAKLFSVDRSWAFIGSSNLDMRSLRLNFEINVECYSSGFACEIDDFIARHRKRRLTHHDLDERSFPVQLRDAAARLMSPYL
ncbi:phospholipase D-like domain-containing protein [Acetobacter fallax]|uniref:Phospholipase D n=1 Tax=Acetobacter fallax TaxID=1737473 RepID=A0ABX0K925_9PROT|nr:phospholipase D-like domain-containing protein [Acetobacter fallax]NHO32303.1 cardiolipin synthase [Acetobacter fallax]NHO35863.1 cardiolipin synthase [Acetobacter fallax]